MEAVQTPGAESHLLRGLLAADVDHRSRRSGQVRRDLQQEGALADARFSGEQEQRSRYEASTEDPVEAFDFEEDAEGADASKYVCANSAYAMAANINRAFKYYGWCSRIRGVESGGAVEGLPVHTFATDDEAMDPLSGTSVLNGIPVEVAPA